MSLTIRERFRRHYNGNANFMTPEVLQYGQRDINGVRYFWELARGESPMRWQEAGLAERYMYGVTVLRLNPDGEGTVGSDLSNSFPSRDDAADYIDRDFDMRVPA